MQFVTENEFWKEAFSAPDPDTSDLPALFRDSDRYAELAGFSPEERTEIQKRIAEFLQDERLKNLYARMYRVMYLEHPLDGGGFQNPQLAPGILPSEECFNLLLLFGGIPRLEAQYKEQGFSDEQFRAAIRDLKVWFEHSAEHFHVFGIARQSGFSWIHAGLCGLIYRFGRLQCNKECKFFHNVKVFRSNKNGTLTAMLDGEMPFTRDGLFAFDEAETAFRSFPLRYDAERRTVSGICSRPDGIAVAQERTLDLAEWTPVLDESSDVLNLHIPADGPLSVASAADAVERMIRFYNEKTDLKIRAFICESWLLDPQFRRILPPDSNLVAFQKAGYLLPEGGESDAVGRVFGPGCRKCTPEMLPRKTRMQKAFSDFLASGGRFRNGRIFLLTDDLPWGGNPYCKD